MYPFSNVYIVFSSSITSSLCNKAVSLALSLHRVSIISFTPPFSHATLECRSRLISLQSTLFYPPLPRFLFEIYLLSLSLSRYFVSLVHTRTVLENFAPSGNPTARNGRWTRFVDRVHPAGKKEREGVSFDEGWTSKGWWPGQRKRQRQTTTARSARRDERGRKTNSAPERRSSWMGRGPIY